MTFENDSTRLGAMLSLDLRGKTALITGASGELGRTMARTLSDCGAAVALHYFQGKDRAERLRDELTANGAQAVCVCGDVADLSAALSIADSVRSQLGAAPDVLVLNAVAQIHPWSTVLEESLEDYESQFRTCVMQAVVMAKAFVPAMQRSGWGRVIGINTECTMQMFEKHSAYVAGKRGMDGVLRVLAREVGQHGITVNQVAPGWTISDKDQTQVADDAQYKLDNPLRRRGSDQEVANVVAFLASELSSYVHGAFVPVCGGNVMPCV